MVILENLTVIRAEIIVTIKEEGYLKAEIIYLLL